MLVLLKLFMLSGAVVSMMGFPGDTPTFIRPSVTSTQDEFISAASAGDRRKVESLIDQGADPNAHDRSGRTALLAAIDAAQNDLVPRLIDLGADVNLPAVNGWTPLMAAARRGQPDIVRELLATGANPEAQSHDGQTALTAGVEGGNEEVVLTLLDEVRSRSSWSTPDARSRVRAAAATVVPPRR
jgi:ankyrin repeat protein